MLIKDVRNISMIGYDHTNNNSKSVIQCAGPLGFAFINVTEVRIAKLKFSSCGAHFPSKVTAEEKFVRPNDFKTKIPNMSNVTFYFLQTINVTISELVISNSTGAGLVGINMFGLSNISQTVFSGNTPKCLLLFLNIHSTSEVISPNILNITNSQMMFGKLTNVLQMYNATGLNITLAQTTYNVYIHIDNIKTYSNMNKKEWNGHLQFVIENWECQCSMIQAKNIVSTNMIRREDIIQVRLESKLHGSLPTCDCTKPAEEEYIMSISDSYFAGMGIQVDANMNNCYTRIKLQNITVQNSTALALHISKMKSIKMQDMNFTHAAGIKIEDSNITAFGRCQFIHNTGDTSIAAFFRSTISFHGDVKFIKNKVQGVAVITADNSTMRFQKTAELVANEGRVGGAIGLFSDSQLVFREQSNVTFLRNCAQQNGGAILIDGSTIVMEPEATMQFIENEAYNGGALAFQNDATITLESNSQITFIKNHAQQNGGALYVEEPTLKFSSYFKIKRAKCFIKLPQKLSSQAMMFSNNTAASAGSSLYGGWVNLCTTGISTVSRNKIINVLFHFQEAQPKKTQLSRVSSNPTRVCMCIDDLPDCNITEYNVTVYPGETFQIPAVAVGQRFGTVPFTVHSRFSQTDSPPEMKALQRTQKVRGNCTNLIYTIASSHQIEEMILTVDKLDKLPAEYIAQSPVEKKLPLVLRNLHFHIQLNPCPLGFVLNISVCTCDPQLTHNRINCSIDTQTVYRQSSKWIRATFINTSQNGVLVHEHCPFDYCRPDSFDLNLEHPDEQCAFHRSSILCGACQHNLSHVFGTSACRECSSLWALLWVPVISLAGIALVVLLIVLNLTVSVGTINGLIFYANIVRANHATFFPPSTTNSFLSRFIAWINLDLGIETCFYNGLDAYVKTWLQFVFPLYVWLIVLLIIIFSHYFDKIAKLSGRSAVQVLATLLLLSYAKLLRIIITVFSFTLIKYPDKTVKVWLYDGNVNYIQGKHIPLLVAAVILLLAISVPYTGMLLFIQCFQKLSNHKLLSWIHKLKPFFDAYTGPYKDRHRYWTGLLLLVRAALFLIISVNAIDNPAVNLLVISLTAFSLITHGAVAGQIYKTWILNTIEYSYFLNLGVLSCATFYTRASDQEDSREATGHGQKAVVYTSVAIALVTFKVIVVMHIVKKVKSFSQCNRLFSESITPKLSKLREKATLAMERKHHSPLPSPAVSPTAIQLRESLLEYCVDD